MHYQQWLAVSLAAFGWGTGGIATRAALGEGAGPWAVVTVRVVVSAALVAIWLLVSRGPRPNRHVLWIGLVMAAFNVIVPYVLFTFAYDNASAGFVSLFAALIPMATALFAWSMLADEPLTRHKLIGLLTGFVGVGALLVSGDSGLESGGRPLFAAALAIISVTSIGYASVYAKRHAGTYDPTEVTGLQFIYAAPVLLVPLLFVEGLPTGVSGTGWAVIVYMGAVSTYLPFYLYYRLLRTVSATTASLIGYVVPLIALVGGIHVDFVQVSPA